MLIPIVALLLLQQAGPLTLDEAVRQALTARGRPAVAAAGVAEARAQRRLAGQIPNPTLSYDRTQDPPRQHLLVDQSFSWLLTRGAERAAAAAAIRRAESDSLLTMLELVQEVRIAFFEALGANETLRLVEEQVASSDSLSRIAAARLAAGDISRLEYDQTAQEARRGQQFLSQARENSRSAAAALGKEIGWKGPGLPVPAGELDVGLLTENPIRLSPDSVPAVRVAVAESTATALTVRGARRGRLPAPSLTAGADWDDPGNPGKTLSVIGIAIPIPIWNFGSADIAVAQARAELASAQSREARLEAARAVGDAEIRLEETARRARFTRDSLIPGARELRLRALAAYRAGETGVLPVLDALRGERDVILSGVQDLLGFQSALARWRALSGRMP